MERSKKILLAIVLVVTMFIFILMGVAFAMRGNIGAGTNLTGILISPFQKMFSSVSGRVGGFFGFVTDMRSYKEENVELRDQLDKLMQENRELSSFQQENQRLRSLLELKSNNQQMDMVGCEIIGKDPGNWFNIFTIDKGSNHNIHKDDVVITGKGLVGHIMEVGSTWAKVIAIIDTNSSVGALVSRTQDIAIVDGDMVLADKGHCKLTYVTSDTSLVLGDTVETSGLGGIYPKGILIGTVSEVKYDATGYSQYAIIDTAVDFERIREVLVIRKHSE